MSTQYVMLIKFAFSNHSMNGVDENYFKPVWCGLFQCTLKCLVWTRLYIHEKQYKYFIPATLVMYIIVSLLLPLTFTSASSYIYKTNIHSVSYQLIGRKINPIVLAVKIPYRTHSAVNTVSTICRIMHWRNIRVKQTDDVIITTSIILRKINYQNSHQLSFPHRL